MKKKAVSAIMLTLLLISMLTLAFNVQLVKTEASRTMNAGIDDGSIYADAVLVVDRVISDIRVKYWEHVINDVIHLKNDFVLMHTNVENGEIIEYRENWRDIEIAELEIKHFEPRKEYFWKKIVAFLDGEDYGYFYTFDDVQEHPFVCWEIRHVDGTTIMYDLDGIEVGSGIPAPTNGFSLSGFHNASWPDPWIGYRQNADSWFNKWCETTVSLSLPTPSTISHYVSDPGYGDFYELAHGGSYGFQADSEGSYYYSSTVATDMSLRSPMKFAFIGSCEGMTYTGPGTFSHEFRKGSMVGTVTVGYSGMATCPGWSVALEWQDRMFQEMYGGYTIKDAFDLASAQYPTIAPCVRFVGDPNLRVRARISVYTDKFSYTTGDKMQLGLDIANPGPALQACVAIWIEKPDSTTQVILHAHAVTLPAGLEYSNPTFKIFTLPSISLGTYTWHAAILDPATHQFLAHDLAEWQFV